MDSCRFHAQDRCALAETHRMAICAIMTMPMIGVHGPAFLQLAATVHIGSCAGRYAGVHVRHSTGHVFAR